MRVDRGPLSLDELRAFGSWIYNACGGVPTYPLVPADEADRILDREPRDDDDLENGFRRKRSAGLQRFGCEYFLKVACALWDKTRSF